MGRRVSKKIPSKAHFVVMEESKIISEHEDGAGACRALAKYVSSSGRSAAIYHKPKGKWVIF